MANAFDQFDEPAKNPFDQFDEPESPLPSHVMAAATTYANDPTQAKLAQQDHEGILEKFGEGFREGWGPERLGFSDQSLDWLRKKGIFSGLEDKANPFQAFNETIGVAAANGLDALTRFPQAVYRALQSAGAEAGLPRDVVSIPDAFMGSPHPTGIPKPFVKPVEIKPIEGANPIQRTIAAKTGDPLIDAVLEHPTVKQVIDNPVVDDSHSVPNSWGGSEPIENPTVYRDKDFPKQITVDGKTIDTAEPAAVHENTEQFAMERMMAGGMDRATALKVAFWEFGEKAEDAWYTAHGMDPAKVEAALKPYVDAIAARKAEPASPLDRLRPAYDDVVKGQGGISSIYISDLIAKSGLSKEQVHDIIREAARNGEVSINRSATAEGSLTSEQMAGALRVPGDETPYHTVRFRQDTQRGIPPDLFKDTYPNGDPAKAAPGPIDKPTPEEVQRGRAILAQSMAEEVSKNAVSLSEARGLGVIGPEKEPVTTGSPAEKAAKSIPAEGVKDEKVTQEVGTAKDAWRQRFDESVGKLKTGEEIKQLIKDAADAQEDFPAARAGDVPLQHVEQIADAAGVDPASINARGLGRQFKTDIEVRLAYQAMISLTEKVKEAARNHKTEPTEQSRIALQEALMRRDLAVEQVVGFRAEWGRVGNTIQEFMERVKNQEQLGEFLNEQGRGRTPKDLDKIANMVEAMDRGGGNVGGLLNDARKVDWKDKLFWYWQNQLISGWLTHTKYAAANATYLAWNRGVITPLARAMDVRSLSDVGHIPLEALSGIAGSISATPHAFMTALRSVKTGLRVPLEGEIELARLATERGEPAPKFAAKPFTPNQRPIAGTLGRIIGAPGDAANAIHTFFRIIGYEGEMQAQAYRAAQLEGHNPLTAQFWDRQAQIRANATEDMMQQGIDVANKGTFIQESGKVAKAVQRATREIPVLRWIFPFTHIPFNLMKATVESTPFAVLGPEARAELMGERGKQVQHTAIARMVAGSALMGWFVNKALNGEATGDYPNDPKDRDLWKLQGKQPNSILINDKWVSFNKFGPIGDLAGIGATLGQAIPHLKSEDDEEMTKATAYLAQAAGRIITDEVGMMSVQMMFEAQKDDKALRTFIASWTSSFAPASSFMGQTASFMDPDMRQAKTIIDGLKYRIPGERQTLLPKRDWSGNPVPNPQYGNLLRQTQAQADPIDLEMARLGIHPTPPSDRIGGVKLPPNMYDKYHAMSAPLTRQMLGGLVNSEGWNDLPPVVREDVIHKTIAAARKSAASALQGAYAGSDTDIIKQGIENKVNKITGVKPTKLQDVPLP